jgi:hypothetical protein
MTATARRGRPRHRRPAPPRRRRGGHRAAEGAGAAQRRLVPRHRFSHAKTFVAVTGAEGVGADPEIEQILAEADDAAARKVLATVGLSADVPAHRAVIRAYGGLVKAAVREWIRGETLTRPQVQLLLTQALIPIVNDVLPEMG